MEILTKIKTPANFNNQDLVLSNAAEKVILQNPEFIKLQQDHKFCDFWLEDAAGFIKVIF